MEIYSICDRNKREYMEDYCKYIVFQTKESANQQVVCAAVADGVSSCVYSDEVARLAVNEILSKSIHLEEAQLLNSAAMAQWVHSSFHDINDLLVNNYLGEKIGTTLSLVVIYDQHALVAACGDSPIYHFSGNNLGQVLELDHEITNSSVLTRWLGNSNVIFEAHTEWLNLNKKDVVFLGSDGAFGRLSEKDIIKVFAVETDIIECAETILSAASRTTIDNQSLIIIRW